MSSYHLTVWFEESTLSAVFSISIKYAYIIKSLDYKKIRVFQDKFWRSGSRKPSAVALYNGKMIKNFFAISAITNIVLQLSQAIITFYIAKLIGPTQFGLFILYMSFINLFISLTETGISSYIIKEKEMTANQINKYYSSFITVIIFPILILFSIILSLYYYSFNNIIMLHLIIILLGGFLNILYIFQKSFLTKNLKFNVILRNEFLSSSISIIITILLAKYTLDVISLLLFYLFRNLFLYVFSYLTTPIRFNIKNININILKKSKDYTLGFLFFNLINYFSRNFDKYLISEGIGKYILGQYGLAYRIMTYPVQMLTGVINSVLFPKLSKLNNKKEIKKEYLSSIFVISFLSLPLMSYISYNSATFVALFFNNDWNHLSFLIKILSICGAIQSILSTVGILYQLNTKTFLMNKIAIINTIIILSSIIIGVFIFHDIEKMAVLYLISYLIIFPYSMHIPLKSFDGNFTDVIKSIFPSLIYTLIFITISLFLNLSFINNTLFSFLLFSVFFLIYRKRLFNFLKNR